MPKSLMLSFCYQIELYLLGNALFIRLSRNILCHCATPFDTFFVNPFDTLLSSQNRSQNRTATCTTHAPSENENFPSAKPPARTSFLSFFPSHFRSSFMNNPVPVSLLSGDRKPQIRFLGNHHSGSGNLYHKSFRM